MSEKKPNIAPKDLMKDDRLALASEHFVLIQTYAQSALKLPKTMDELRSYLGDDAPGDLGEFAPLVDVYRSMHDASLKWKDETFPATVRLASDIVQYGKQKAPPSFRALLSSAQKLAEKPDDNVTKTRMLAVLDSLQQDARRMQERASQALAAVREFADLSKRDSDTLVVNNGGGLWQKYQNRYAAVDNEVKRLWAELEEKQKALQQESDNYAHDATVAATTPAYAWIFPFGLIAAVVVAGVYGKRATDAQAAADALKAKIDSLRGDAAAQAKVVTSLQLASTSITRIALALAAALPVIQTIQGFWSSIADDLGEIARLIEDDIAAAPAIIMDLGIEEAVSSWETVAAAADRYRNAAFVNVVDIEQWKKEHPEAFAEETGEAAGGVA